MSDIYIASCHGSLEIAVLKTLKNNYVKVSIQNKSDEDMRLLYRLTSKMWSKYADGSITVQARKQKTIIMCSQAEYKVSETLKKCFVNTVLNFDYSDFTYNL